MKFRFSLAELSGALADLGVLLPLTLALVGLNGLNPTGVFIGLGLAYVFTALAYRLPVPVQPLKSFAATALALGLSGATLAAGAWWMAALFLVLTVGPAGRLIGALFPRPVVRGIQLGLCVLLLQSAWGLVLKPSAQVPLWVAGLAAAGAALVLAVALWRWRDAAGLGVIAFGLAFALAREGWPDVSFSATLPALAPAMPGGREFVAAFWLLALPQLPLSLANSVYATADAARQYFGAEAGRVTPRRLLATMSLNNVVAAVLGGVPVCHGCGGLTAHYRLGARTGGAPLMLGVLFLAVGVLGGRALLPLVGLLPTAVLGVLLAYVGVQHALLAKDLRGAAEWTPALAVMATTLLTRNLALGFAVGAGLHFGLRAGQEARRRWRLAHLPATLPTGGDS
jgi:hypothetical protein